MSTLKILKGHIGAPTAIISCITLVLYTIMLPHMFVSVKGTVAGNCYLDLIETGMTSIDAKNIALAKGTEHAILYLGSHSTILLLFLISIWIISSSTTAHFKRLLCILFPFIASIGIVFLALSVDFLDFNFPYSLLPSLVIYLAISTVLWAIIGVSLLLKKILIKVKNI